MSSSVMEYQYRFVNILASRLCRRRMITGLAAICLLLMHGFARSQSYMVYPWPLESPNHGSRSLVTAPHDPMASPFGWHDTNGVAGAEYTTLRGNNAYVFLDLDGNNVPDGPGPDGGAGLTFDYAVDFASQPSSYYEALAANAFYWTNRLHDIFLRHGFTPARGNMQENTYGLGGIGNDPVKVALAWGSSIGNYNNVTTIYGVDGTSPTIKHFMWVATDPRREGSFDAGLTTFAYGVLMFTRLASTCAVGPAGETPYFGYADFLALLVTTDFHTATADMPRGIGTYLLGQPTNGAGVRGIAYSTDFAIFPRTYKDLPSMAIPAQTGTIWAGALWDLTWAMIAKYGASNDLLNGNGGENRMLRLAIEGMHSMTCPAGFVTARDSILAADLSVHGGQDRCMIWSAFARRGLGAGAAEGSPSSITDQTVSFNMPVECGRIFANGFE